MSSFDDLPEADSVTVGALGPPGRRVFLLQARSGPSVLTLKVEKVQVAALSEYLEQIVRQVSPAAEELLSGSELSPAEMELDTSHDPSFTVGSIGLGYDQSAQRVVLVAEEAAAEGEEKARARIAVTPRQAAALAVWGARLVAAGRPACPLCGYPLDPSGHICPRTNGHRPPEL